MQNTNSFGNVGNAKEDAWECTRGYICTALAMGESSTPSASHFNEPLMFFNIDPTVFLFWVRKFGHKSACFSVDKNFWIRRYFLEQWLTCFPDLAGPFGWRKSFSEVESCSGLESDTIVHSSGSYWVPQYKIPFNLFTRTLDFIFPRFPRKVQSSRRLKEKAWKISRMGQTRVEKH